jgi:hypothetical protein
MTGAEVVLSWHEVAMASEIGRLRQLASIKASRLDRHGFSGNGWDVHIEGACGELAAAKYLDLYWDGSVDTFKANDLPLIQVRTRSRHDYELLVRPEDDDEAIWVLVTGQSPCFWLRGWLMGRECKRFEWVREHGGRPPAYFVPTLGLRPISQLRFGLNKRRAEGE